MQANFGARRELVIAGAPVGLELVDDDPMAEDVPAGAGSIIGLLLTDAPLLPNQCEALARRMPIGVGRTGSSVSHFSGDLFLAASVAAARDAGSYREVRHLRWGDIDPFFEAAVQATEEAILNALFVNAEMVGRDGHRSPALPVERVLEMLARRQIV